MTEVADKPKLNPAQLRTTLQQALDFLNRNEFVAAEAALDRVLTEQPGEADALQLMGVLRRQQNRGSEAEPFYRRAIAANPNMPHVYHNLGNLLRSQGRHEEAAECQRAALRLRSGYFEAH